MPQDLILDAAQIDQRIIRIAYQIYENHMDEKHLILAGVSDNGHEFAKLLEQQLKSISDLALTVGKVDINKDAPFSAEIALDLDDKELVKKSVILIDDVLNSGKTAAFALKALLKVNVKTIDVAVMVNRSHKAFPIYPKYSGYELATTINEHVTVQFKGKDKGVYLS
ncbi:phosphoribosyltransferase family protein [Reichenbachiella agarivorans]|uniref:Phosphoribosyltransferase family protein n=1 Tax=Reichenbachiella agarivorans TaxID=2979464 RepID=A0ABY6CR12_9BACT|nr:phosphoribosyltransferase family protein [Reichenbachiella agarivorans]UXP32949.1 phosphoribosyltransferase family protein [Reichenbachiella agarivorans]